MDVIIIFTGVEFIGLCDNSRNERRFVDLVFKRGLIWTLLENRSQPAEADELAYQQFIINSSRVSVKIRHKLTLY